MRGRILGIEIIGWIIFVAPFAWILHMPKVRQADCDRVYGPQGQGGTGPAQGMPLSGG
jgi:hypothetical protein